MQEVSIPTKLSVRRIDALTKPGHHQPGRHTDGDGLHLHVRPDGTAAWVLRYRLHGRQRDLGLGAYPAVGLADARIKAREARGLIDKGLDPKLERQRARTLAQIEAASDRTFQAAAEALMASRGEAWRSAKHASQWTSTLHSYAYPTIGDWPVAQVDTEAVLTVLRPVWQRAPETGSRLRGRIEAILDFACARGWRSGENPARWRGHLAELLPSPRRLAPTVHQPALPWAEVPAFMVALERHSGTAAKALAFAILAGARSGEVRGMRWSEVDMVAGIWTVPASRMKAKRLHRVPLVPEAIRLLRRLLPDAAHPTQHVFRSSRAGRPLSDMALSQLVRGMATDGLEAGARPRWLDREGRVVVPHGFRTSFRGWIRAQGYPDHLGEIALAHTDPDRVRAAYARDDLLEERRPMMEAWARFILASVDTERSAA